MNKVNLSRLSEEELLKLRICDLGLNLNQSSLMKGINQLYFELNCKLINFLPRIWFSDDWFSPDGHAGFAIPFYLSHPRLVELEKKYIGKVEGTNLKSLMKLLRHETGHAIDNAFYLRRDKKRQILFGSSKTKYPKSYIPDPKSKSYVRYLEDFYAQSHPDEDWAETFAVWLDPNSQWQKKYLKWTAMEKLDFIDKKFKTLQNEKQINYICQEVDSIHKDTRTLKQYFQDKRKNLRLHKQKPLFQKVDARFIPFVLVNKPKVIEILNRTNNLRPFVINKMIKDFSIECKTQKINLKYQNKISSKALEKQLQLLTKEYLKQGRHRIVM